MQGCMSAIHYRHPFGRGIFTLFHLFRPKSFPAALVGVQIDWKLNEWMNWINEAITIACLVHLKNQIYYYFYFLDRIMTECVYIVHDTTFDRKELCTCSQNLQNFGSEVCVCMCVWGSDCILLRNEHQISKLWMY